MSWLSMVVAFILTLVNGAGVPDPAWLDLYLDYLVKVEAWLLSFWLVLLVGTVILLIVLGLFSLYKRSGCGESMGCLAIVVILFFAIVLLEWLTLILAREMANSVDPTGIINAGKFWVSTVIFLLIGAG